ncbi:SDR family NAD(P)-dependent oxidoreductase [Oceaniovalibus sp. ACAM 378]|uniref:SDR family NAD(P)-dependent oxidoreductase n=1 Tax=Oceaniovalibus sp. ACAM 378 TaxID=2599923 RepID=UPI0011D78B17|nr:SDR family oxidoreductase [Oceaniovalibus sp. ACAM 378]TYB88652.1 SDR family oxidoreductase [Oceaniovalibus sp. ACAM 378]
MTDLFNLTGKRTFITGGSRGLGREMALALAGAGADIALVARPSDALQQTAEDIRALGRTAWVLEADVGDPEAADAICHRALEELGSFDILINNVGGRRVNVPTEDLDLLTWREMMHLNLTSTFLCSRIIGGAMIKAGKGGRIINIASINAMVAGRGIGGRHYETAKAAVLQFTRTLAVDWAPHGITANAICPGLFATEPNRKWQESNPEMIERLVADIPMGSMGNPKDIGALAVYLASDSAGFITGASLVIDGGYTCV